MSQHRSHSREVVASRLRAFRARFPGGRIHTRIVRWTRRHVVLQAMVFRSRDESRPAATAYGVWYREVPTTRHPVVDGMLESVESLAIERALALLDPSERPIAHSATGAAAPTRTPLPWPGPSVAAARHQPSRRDPRAVAGSPYEAPVPPARADAVPAVAPAEPPTPVLVRDLLALITRAEAAGVRTRRAERWRSVVSDAGARPPVERLVLLERRLRQWLAVHSARACPGSVLTR